MSFIRPKLEYGSVIWDDCSKHDKDRLENFQIKAARIVTGAKKGTSHEVLYKELNWDKLSDRRQQNKITFMHKIVNNHVPDYLLEILPKKLGDETNIVTRGKGKYKNVQCKTEKYKKTFLPDCIKAWNNLDSKTKNVTDIDSFKKIVCKSWTSKELYNYGERKWNNVHAQMRLKCSNLNAHLYSLHVLDDPMCIHIIYVKVALKIVTIFCLHAPCIQLKDIK